MLLPIERQRAVSYANGRIQRVGRHEWRGDRGCRAAYRVKPSPRRPEATSIRAPSDGLAAGVAQAIVRTMLNSTGCEAEKARLPMDATYREHRGERCRGRQRRRAAMQNRCDGGRGAGRREVHCGGGIAVEVGEGERGRDGTGEEGGEGRRRPKGTLTRFRASLYTVARRARRAHLLWQLTADTYERRIVQCTCVDKGLLAARVTRLMRPSSWPVENNVIRKAERTGCRSSC